MSVTMWFVFSVMLRTVIKSDVYLNNTCITARWSTGGRRPCESAGKRQSLVHSFTPPLRTVVRSCLCNAPQISDTSLAKPMVTFQRNGVPGNLVTQRTPRRCVQYLPHFLLKINLCLGKVMTTDRGGAKHLNPATPAARLKRTVQSLGTVHVSPSSSLTF